MAANKHELQLTTRGDREIVLTRTFRAPRSLVFKAMTTPELTKRWLLGPPGWSMVTCEIDLKVGGVFRYEWRNSDSTRMGMHGVYREVVPCERIVNTESFDLGCEPQSGEQITTTSLSEDHGHTTLTSVVLYPSREARDATIASGMEHGLAASYERFARLLRGKKRLRAIYQIFAGTVFALVVLIGVALRVNTTGSFERTFNAPSDRLWRVWNDPDFIKQWWGPKDFTAPIIRNDPRVGGTYLWSMKSPKGEMFWNTGVYKEVVPTSRIVSTSSFSDATGRAIPGSQAPVPGHWPNEIIVITEFTESGGKTKVTVTEMGIPLIVRVFSTIAWDQQFDKIESLL